MKPDVFEPDKRSLLKIFFFLFLPLLSLPPLLGALHIGLDDLRSTGHGDYFWLFRAAPFIASRAAGPFTFLLWWLSFLAALVLFHCVASRHRKSFVAGATCLYIAGILGPAFLAAFLLGLALIWAAVKRPGSLAARIPLVAGALALVAWAAAAEKQGLLRFIAGFSVMTLALRSYSLMRDLDETSEPIGGTDFLSYMVGGFPFLYYPFWTYYSFSRSYLARPYWEIARGGIVRVYSGLAKLTAAFLIDGWAFHAGARFVSTDYADPGVSSSRLWLAGLVLLFTGFMRMVGSNQLQIGIGRLWGFETDDHHNQPWLSQSPLDYWRRISLLNALYLQKYVFFPLYRKLQSPYIPVCAVFLATAFLNDFYVPGRPDRSDVLPVMLVVFTAFALVCCAQVWRQERRPARSAASALWSRGFKIAAMLALLVLMHASQPPLFDLTHPPAGRPGLSLAARYALLYRKLLFIP